MQGDKTAKMMKALKQKYNRIRFARDISGLERELKEIYQREISLKDLTGRGATFTFLVQDMQGNNLSVAKLFNPRRERISREINSRLEEYVYLDPQERFGREFDLLDNLAKQSLAPKPIKAARTYILQEYLPGRSLTQAVEDKRSDFSQLYFQALRLLKKLHDSGNHHGQPSMDNMILSGKQIKMVDFEHCLNKEKLSAEQMSAIDILRFMVDARSKFPQEHQSVIGELSHFLTHEIGPDIYRDIENVLSLQIFNGNAQARIIFDELKAKDTSRIDIGPLRERKETAQLLKIYTPEERSQDSTIERGIKVLYKRFPRGLFVAREKTDIIGYVSVGFQRPAFLLRLIGRLPFVLPHNAFYLLLKNGILAECEIANIYVMREYRRKGVAGLLMQYAEEYARAGLKQAEIYLLVRKENTAALSLYQRLGYKRWASVKVKSGSKIKMRKVIANKQRKDIDGEKENNIANRG